jgi:hypothetical protein
LQEHNNFTFTSETSGYYSNQEGVMDPKFTLFHNSVDGKDGKNSVRSQNGNETVFQEKRSVGEAKR